MAEKSVNMSNVGLGDTGDNDDITPQFDNIDHVVMLEDS